jgi:hypothetical protein
MSRIDIFGLAKQTDASTKNATMEYYPPVESCEVEHAVETMEVDETTGHRFPTGMDYGTEFWNLSLKATPRMASLPRLLSMWFGQPVTSTPDAGGAPAARNHQFLATPTSAAPKEHSIFAVRKDPSPAIIDLFWTCLGDELSFAIESNDFLKLEGAIIARELDDTQSAPTQTLDNTARMSFDQVKCYASVNGAGEAEVKVRKFAVTYQNNLDTEDVILGTRRLQSLNVDNAMCEVSFQPTGALSTEYRRALLSDPDKVKLRFEALGAVIGAATKYKVEFIIYACEYIEAPANIDAGERLKDIEITARARYDEVASKFVECNVVNIVATY